MESNQSHYCEEPTLEIRKSNSKYKENVKKITPKHKLISAVGNEPWLRDQVVARVKSYHSNLEQITLDCSELSEPDIFSKLLSRDLFTKERLFILNNFTKIKKLDFFIKNNLKDTIVFISEKAGKSKLYKEIINRTVYVDCDKPKPWLEAGDALGKILGYLKSKGYTKVSQDTAMYLYEQIGYNLYKIISEIDKLIMYKRESQPDSVEITVSDIDKVCVKGIHYNLFDLIDKILAGNKKNALHLLSKIFNNESNPSILLINLWYVHFENLLYLKDTKKKDSLLTSYIKMPPMVIQKKLIPQANKIPTGKIIESMHYLTEIDYNLRKGSFDLRYYLEKFILDY